MTTRSRAAAGLALLAVAAGLGLSARALWPRPQPTPALLQNLAMLEIESTHSVDTSGSWVVARGVDPFIVLRPPPQPVRAVRLDYVPRSNGMRHDFYVYYASGAGEGFSQQYVVWPRVVHLADRWQVEFTLPVAARALRLDVPDDAEFSVVDWQTAATPFETRTAPSRTARLLTAIAVVLALFAVHVGWMPHDVNALRRIVALTLIVPGVVVLFLLPPFQGPDENAHWYLALEASRAHVFDEPAALFLPDTLETAKIPFHPERKFDPGRFAITSATPRTLGSPAAWMTKLHDNYPYARWYGYPFVAAASLFVPRVETTQQALVFFYLSRLLAGLTFLALLTWAVRRYQIPALALAFFSLPLFLQQSIIVSADTLLNLGALAAALLFLRLRERHSWIGLTALWLLALVIVSVKFIYAPLLLLPLVAMPEHLRRRTVVAAAVLAVLGAYPAILAVVHQVRHITAVLGRSPEGSAQLASLTTATGWHAMAEMYARYAATLRHAAVVSGPLGWLDTPFSQMHLSLIRVSAIVAIVADLYIVVRAWPACDRGRRQWLAAAAALAIASMIFVTAADVVLFFLMTTNPSATDVAGVQMRHFFPIMVAAVVIGAAPISSTAPSRSSPLWTFAWTLLGALVLGRSILLALDLLQRYW